MEYTVPNCPEALGTSVEAQLAWTAGVSAMATRCQATAVDELKLPCEDLECGDSHICNRCSMTLDMAGITIEMMLGRYLNQVQDVVIQSLAAHDPFGVECLANLVARNILAIQM